MSSNPKVFELAKEIGVETLVLMDKIKEWKLPVRNHMAELSPDLVSEIKLKINEASSPSKSTTKKVVKKKVTKKSSDSAEASPGKTASKKTVTRKTTTVRKKAATSKSAESTESTDSAPTAIVRRKAGAQKQAERAEEAAQIALGKAAQLAEEEAYFREQQEQAYLQSLAEQARAEAESAAGSFETENGEQSGQEFESDSEPALQAQASEAQGVEESSENLKETLTVDSSSSSQMAPNELGAADLGTTASPRAASSSPANSVAAAGAAPAVAPRTVKTPVAPTPPRGRDNIIGRIDLKKFENRGGGFRPQGGPRPQFTPGSRPQSGFVPRAGSPHQPGQPGRFGTSTGPAPGGAFPNRGARVGGFGSAPNAPSMMGPPSTGFTPPRREERPKKLKSGSGAAAGGASKAGALEEVPSFTASEFRKREIVFQPKKKKISAGNNKSTLITTPSAHKRIVEVFGAISVGDLAMAMGVKAPKLMGALMKSGVMAKINTVLDFETAALIAPEFEFEVVNVQRSPDELIESFRFGKKDAELVQRPPVVTVMGHVDHGKTSLLDAIRKSDVVSGEAGGITQHIGAYSVRTENGKIITFIDTPGHAAFTQMRARGANVTDVAIIVVAADDGVMPQTEEAISHAKNAGVPIIVALNKIDKPDSNPDKVKQQLTEFGLVPEDWGGDTIYCPVSAIKKTGIAELLEQIDTVSEVAELRANPLISASGVVIESKVDKGRGAVATLLVQNGTLKQGDYIVAGGQWGRVRSLINDKGERVESAGPSTPVEVLGLSGAPSAGDRFDVTEKDSQAQEIAELRQAVTAVKDTVQAPHSKMSLEDLFSKVKTGDLKELPIVLKTDVAGSIEAIRGMFDKLSTDEVRVKVIHSAVGGISESDVLLASTAKGLIIGFNVRPDNSAIKMAEREGIEIRTYSIVYELIDEMKKALSGLLTPDIIEKTVGHAEVRETFNVPKVGVIAGCMVQDGRASRSDQIRVLRDGKIVYTGKLQSLKRFKDDAREVQAGYECGMNVENFNDIKVGDVIEFFVQEQVSREL